MLKLFRVTAEALRNRRNVGKLRITHLVLLHKHRSGRHVMCTLLLCVSLVDAISTFGRRSPSADQTRSYDISPMHHACTGFWAKPPRLFELSAYCHPSTAESSSVVGDLPESARRTRDAGL